MVLVSGLTFFINKVLKETGSVVILEQNYVYSAYMPLAFEQFFSNYLREIRDQHSSTGSSVHIHVVAI